MIRTADIRAKWVAVDWGTTHLRAWIMGPEDVQIAHLESTDGMGKLAPDQFEMALLSLIGPYLGAGRTVPVICCGMAGARQGWVEARYCTAPCRPPGAEQAVAVPARDGRITARILPGVSQSEPADVMRGEETQIAGYLAQNPDFDGVVCLPGTHTKWVHISAGEIVSFKTFMTGELFALLSEASVLRHSVATTGWDDDAFALAVADAMSRPQSAAAALFALRAGTLLHDTPPETSRARLSGLLIGLELAGARPYWLGQRITLIGSKGLSRSYRAALSAQGAPTEQADAGAMTLAGLKAAYDQLKDTMT
jgi:2-dehydro-3-deoxygalactonokinase